MPQRIGRGGGAARQRRQNGRLVLVTIDDQMRLSRHVSSCGGTEGVGVAAPLHRTAVHCMSPGGHAG